MRLPARTTLESLVASVRSLVERQVSLQQLIAPFGVTAWSGLASRVERRNTLSSELVVVDAKLAAALGSDTLETIHNRECELAASRDQILAAEPSWAAQEPDVQELRAAIAARKADREQMQVEARAVWAEADRDRTAAANAAATATANRTTNGEALGTAERLSPGCRRTAGRSATAGKILTGKDAPATGPRTSSAVLTSRWQGCRRMRRSVQPSSPTRSKP